MSKSVVGNMSDWSGVLSDVHRQIGDGSLTLGHFQAFLEHRNPFAITNIREEWQEFYRKYFRITVDFSGVAIPEKLDDFTRVVFIPQGLTYADIVKVLKKKFKTWFYTEKLDKDIKDDVRTSDKSYAVRFRERVEADEEMKSLSANDLKAKDINSITLMERLILELKYFDETGEHLDISNVTLCAGSRRSGGAVPYVYWHDDKLQVHWYDPGFVNDDLRARVAVSA
ncbi:MAG: hypothetical protein ACKKL6_02775 [Candidatus Komeilibacteria bacterium]